MSSSVLPSSAELSLKAKIIEKLIHQIKVNKEGIQIHFYVGQKQLERRRVEIAGSQSGESRNPLLELSKESGAPRGKLWNSCF
jgi:hypothetical protein